MPPGSASKLEPEVRAGVDIVEGDLRSPETLVRAVRGAHRVFHCAGYVQDWGPEEAFVEANVRGTERLLDAARSAGVRRFVHLSSIAVFGVPSPPTFDDASPYAPGRDPYSRTKIAGEQAALRAYREHGFPVTVLRPAVVYGPRGTWAEEPAAMIRAGTMFLLGGGEGTCHPCYVENLVDAMLLAAEHPRALGEGFIVGDDQPMTFRAYFDHLARAVGRGPVRRSIPLPVARAMATALEAAARLRRSGTRPLLTHAALDMLTVRSRMSMSKLRQQLGFAPRYGVDEAMAELAAYWRRCGRQPS